MNQPPSPARPRSLGPAVIAILLVLIVLGSLRNGGTPELRGAPAAELTPLAYLPVVKRAGPTATPTETPQQPCLAVYPIGLNAALFNANGFAPPTDPAELPYYGIYNDATYKNKTQRRVYLNPSTLTSILLSWNPAVPVNAAQFTAALSGTGTLSQGFEEVVPWPDPNSAAPSGYPLLPGQLGLGDWVRTVDLSLINSTGSIAALQYHLDHRTVMALPIVNALVYNGQTGAAHFGQMGNFLLRGFALGGPSPYFDLVYIGASDLQVPLCS
jgi:hypothetical protein